LALKVDADPPAPTPRAPELAERVTNVSTHRSAVVNGGGTAKSGENKAKREKNSTVKQRLDFDSPATASAPHDDRARVATATRTAREPQAHEKPSNATQNEEAIVKAQQEAEERLRDAERTHKETMSRLREALEEAEQKAKISATNVLELQERLHELKEANVSEARVLARKEAQLRRREEEFNVEREMLSSQLEAAIYSANMRDSEALERDEQAKDEIRAAKVAASEYELNDAQRREFSLKAGWCAHYLHRMIALRLVVVDEDVQRDAKFLTAAFGVDVNEEDTSETIVKRVDEVIIAAACKPVGSYEVDTSLLESSLDDDMDSDQDVPSSPAPSPRTSLPPSQNATWPRNFRDALQVEICMRHLVAVRAEERVIVALGDARRMESVVDTSSSSAGVSDSNALSAEEIQEFHFRRAWLRLMWARAREAGIHLGISDDREEHWSASMRAMTDENMRDAVQFKRDALAVDKGLKEMRTLSIETRLWL
jgi:hypothetical protein